MVRFVRCETHKTHYTKSRKQPDIGSTSHLDPFQLRIWYAFLSCSYVVIPPVDVRYFFYVLTQLRLVYRLSKSYVAARDDLCHSMMRFRVTFLNDARFNNFCGQRVTNFVESAIVDNEVEFGSTFP